MIPCRVATPARRHRRAGLALAAGIALHGCTAPPPAATSSFGSGADQAQSKVPPGAIRIDDQLYQVPIGADDDGCPRYRLYSPTKLVPQAIYYRDPAGDFTPDRQEAACAGRASD
jgi:hypothetical protein